MGNEAWEGQYNEYFKNQAAELRNQETTPIVVSHGGNRDMKLS